MRKLIIIIITAITIVACVGNSDKKAKTENVKLLLDSISESTKMKSGNQQIECEAEVFYPKDVESIKKDLTELVKQLGQEMISMVILTRSKSTRQTSVHL